MSGWRDIGKAHELERGEHWVVDLPDHQVLVVNVGGHYYAVENLCTHDRGELGGGMIEDDRVICPRHGACFSLRTGEVLEPPAFEDLLTFPVKVESGRLLLSEQPDE